MGLSAAIPINPERSSHLIFDCVAAMQRQRNRGAGMLVALGWSMWLMCFSREYSLTLFPIVAPAKHVLSLLKGEGPSFFPAFEVQG